jgi:hypothetical protein
LVLAAPDLLLGVLGVAKAGAVDDDDGGVVCCCLAA